MDDEELDQPEPEPGERRLNIQMPTELIGGTYSNFANVSFSQYEFTLTFMRIEHEIEEGDVPGTVVSRVNASPRFVPELHRRARGLVVEVRHARGHPQPARGARPLRRAVRRAPDDARVRALVRRPLSRAGGDGGGTDTTGARGGAQLRSGSLVPAALLAAGV